MGRKLRADLGGFVDDLTGTVDSLWRKFRKQQGAVHQDCIAAHRSFEQVKKVMAAKRKNFHASLARAEQKGSSFSRRITPAVAKASAGLISPGGECGKGIRKNGAPGKHGKDQVCLL
jgi:hypothetical protein